jgi:hypothetical protein
MSKIDQDRMSDAIRIWIGSLDNEPGWKEWKLKHIARTLSFDAPFPLEVQSAEEEFVFSDAITKQHAVVSQYLGLAQTICSLKDCEYYFRRYPFRGLPVTRHDHLTNVCEIYFSRFYEFKSRMKKYFEAVKAASPNHGLEIGKFIKLFEKTFERELRARNGVHHDCRFEDIAIDRVFLTESISLNDQNGIWKREHTAAYRKVVGEWARRVRVRGLIMDEFLEAIAKETLSTCVFLKPSQPDS